MSRHLTGAVLYFQENVVAFATIVLALGCGSDVPASTSTDAAVLTDARLAPPTRPDATPPPDGDTRPLPDLAVNLDRMRIDLAIEKRFYPDDACELDADEACIGGSGMRTLLRFAVETPNIGNADLELGVPNDSNENFAYSDCHGHYHFDGYAEYNLINVSDQTKAVGQKQAFCLLDSNKYVLDDPSVSDESKYWCGFQGIQRGWSDVYHARLACQFIDITDVPDGDYNLKVFINRYMRLEELRYDNNLYQLPITIGDPNLSTPTEPCPTDIDAHSSSGTHRECGWTFEGAFDCEAGASLRVGCSAECDLGSCTGDPMMRVCDPAREDGNCSFAGNTGSSDDCDSLCPRIRNIDCPASGQIDVYTAPHTMGEAYTCNIRVASP